MERIFLRRTTAIGMTVVALMVATATSAGAGVPAGCTAPNNYTGSGAVNFYHVSGEDQTRIYSFDWNINGQSGSTQNDVIIELKRDVSLGEDTRIYNWSTGSARNGTGRHEPASEIEVPRSWSVYGTFRFVFDRNNLPDPACTAQTAVF